MGPDITVDIPGVGAVNFPDTMKPEEIDAAAKRLHDEANPPESLGRRVGRAALDTLPGIGGIVGGVLSTPETLGAGTIPGAAIGVGAGQGLRDLIGHYTGLDAPTTPVEKAGNIAKETAIAGATGVLLPGVVAAVRTPIQTLREGAEQFGSAMPPTIRRLGKLFPSMPKSAPGPVLTRPSWQMGGSVAEDAPRIRMGTSTAFEGAPPKGAPSWSQWSAERPAGSSPSPASAQPSSSLSVADRTALARQGYPAEAIAKIEQAAAGKPAPMAAHSSAPTAPTPTPVDPALQGPRVRVGAERVGRQTGMTTQDVRTAAGPVLDEAVGDASPILPQKALQNIIDTLKQLPKGGAEREAYVARATSGKTKWQVENIRRTLEHLGLIVPVAAAAPTVRDGLMRMMSSHGRQDN